MDAKELSESLKRDKIEVENLLVNCFNNIPFEVLKDAMKYSVLAGGKRLRPILLLKTYCLFSSLKEENAKNVSVLSISKNGEKSENAQKVSNAENIEDLIKKVKDSPEYVGVLRFAAAIEFIHTYSLIHDDLPSFDNDSLRRGKPTNHVLFGEANAILAGDGLLNLSYEFMLSACLKLGKNAVVAANYIASCAGAYGMVAGQCADIYFEKNVGNLDNVEFINSNKTSKLITAAIVAGAYLAKAKSGDIKRLISYGENLGQLFQLTDDILDYTSTETVLGKSTNKDEKQNKLNYVSVLKLKKASHLKEKLVGQCKKAVLNLSVDNSYFISLADMVASREN